MTIVWHVVGYCIAYGRAVYWRESEDIWFSSKNLGMNDRGFL